MTEAGTARPRPLRLAGLEPLNIDDDSLFVNIGERTNVTGSKAFARLILAGDFTGAVDNVYLKLARKYKAVL